MGAKISPYPDKFRYNLFLYTIKTLIHSTTNYATNEPEKKTKAFLMEGTIIHRCYGRLYRSGYGPAKRHG